MTNFAPRSFASTLVGWSAVLAILAALQLTGCTDDGWVVDPAQTLPDDDDDATPDDDDVTPAPADDDETAADDDDAAGDDDVADDDDATPPYDDDDTVEPPADDDDVTDAQPADADGDGRTDVIDCDDTDASVYPGAPEVCEDGIDQDCDGSVDEGCDDEPADDDDTVEPPADDDDDTLAPDPVVDADGDGYAATNAAGNVVDCNDLNGSIHPGATEVCGDAIDQDCSGADAACPPSVDTDGDGSPDVVDCADLDASIYPGAPDVCGDGIDSDCDGFADETPFSGFIDFDGDGWGSTPFAGCGIPSTGVSVGGDCNDLNASIHPGAMDICGDGIDQNCNGEDFACPSPTDADGDGYTPVVDCNDLDASVHPGATEVCNFFDEDCDGVIDEGFDADGDTWTVCELDCDDLDATVHPFAVDLCGDGIDSDCDYLASDETPFSGFIDLDGDGFGSTPFAGCAIPPTGVSVGGDCNDADPLVYPGASETTPGVDDIDNDCDGAIDEDFEAFVRVTYPTSWTYTLSVQFFWAGSVIGDWWDATASVPGAPLVSYTFLASQWDIEGACGLRFNVTEGAPASGWYCQGDALNSVPEVDIWWQGTWYDEDDLDVWSVPGSPGGDCSALLLLSTAAICQP